MMERRKPSPEPIVEKEIPVEPINPEEELKWFHNKGKTFRMGGRRIIKPGQTFQAREKDVPSAFRDIIVPVGGPRSAEERATTPAPVSENPRKKPHTLTPVEVVKTVYTVVSDTTSGGWNVQDPQGKVLNENPILDQLEAEALAKSLSS